MSIRLVKGCVNCDNLLEDYTCKVHEAKVEKSYTCDSFDMRSSLIEEVECTTCAKFHTTECPNKENAAVGMLCNAFAPKSMN